MIRGDEKISVGEIEEFMKGISSSHSMTITRKDMSRYLQAFPQKCPEGKDPFA